MEINNDHKNWAKRMARRKWITKEYRSAGFWTKQIEQQDGKCALTGAKLLFQIEHGIAPCHPLYASIDHAVPGNEKKLQIVCYDINDLKGHLPQPLFEALSSEKEWEQFKLFWRNLSKEIPDKKGAFKILIKFGKQINFIETTKVAKGVERDVYKFVDDANCDLGIIRIKAGCKTPPQKVLKGGKTFEGYLLGKGKSKSKGALTITDLNGKQKIYQAQKGLEVEVKIGETKTIQWQANNDSDLEVYEICCPPYEPGRFQNLQG